MVRTCRIEVERFCTTSPWRDTSAGRSGRARWTRLLTLMAFWSGLVPISNVTVRFIVPEPVDVESWYSMFSTPLICCSSGAATVAATVSAVAPG